MSSVSQMLQLKVEGTHVSALMPSNTAGRSGVEVTVQICSLRSCIHLKKFPSAREACLSPVCLFLPKPPQ